MAAAKPATIPLDKVIPKFDTGDKDSFCSGVIWL